MYAAIYARHRACYAAYVVRDTLSMTYDTLSIFITNQVSNVSAGAQVFDTVAQVGSKKVLKFIENSLKSRWIWG